MVHQVEAHKAIELGHEGFVGRHLDAPPPKDSHDCQRVCQCGAWLDEDGTRRGGFAGRKGVQHDTQ